MSSNIVKLNPSGRSITLVGTAHVSRESITEVEEVIRREKPDTVCVEIDDTRFKSMTDKNTWEKLNIVKVFREGKGFLLIANLVMAGFQRRMGVSLGVKPGEEMMAAVSVAEELGIPYVFCDREVQITLRRAWARCSLWSRCKLLASLLSSAFSTEKLDEKEIESLKQASELDGMMAELSSYLPAVKETLIDERDRYLAAKIWDASPAAAGKTVAIVGAGHLAGIEKRIEKMAAGEENTQLGDIDTVPPPSLPSRAAGWILPAAIVALIVAGFFRAGFSLSFSMLLRWVLWNGSLAALGTLVALGHPLSILVSFLGAPIATINPFIGVGLFSGITEASIRKPRVQDAENIAEAFSSIRGIYRNRIARALLVFFLSSLGGAVGNFISIPALAEALIR